MNPLPCASCGMTDKPVNLAGRCHWCAESWRLRHPRLVTAARTARICLAATARRLITGT